MSRGFAIGVNVASADELTSEKIADEVTAQGLLTAVESQTFLPAAIAAAQAMINAIGAGPYWVWLDGTDNLASVGETTSLVVRVNSLATPSAPSGAAGSNLSTAPADTATAAPAPDPAPAPAAEAAPAEPQPNGEPAPGVAS